MMILFTTGTCWCSSTKWSSMKSSEKGAPYPNLWGLQWLLPLLTPQLHPQVEGSQLAAATWLPHGTSIKAQAPKLLEVLDKNPGAMQGVATVDYPPVIKHSNGKSLKKMEVSLAGKIIRKDHGFPASHVWVPEGSYNHGMFPASNC